MSQYHKLGIAILAVLIALALPDVLAIDQCGGCGSGYSCECDNSQPPICNCELQPSCGDGSCNGGETQATCCDDCACSSGQSCNYQTHACVTNPPQPYCGDNVCSSGESFNDCWFDCPPQVNPDYDNDSYTKYGDVQQGGIQQESISNADCNDNDATINPGATESCNGKDDDCDGQVDNGCEQKSLLFFNQRFRGCGLGNPQITHINNRFLLNSPYSSTITNETECSSLGSWYCDIDGNWKNNSITDPFTNQKVKVAGKSSTPDGTQSGCCPSGWCFKGTGQGCFPNQAGNYYAGGDYRAAPFTYNSNPYRCANGNWVPYIVKWDWDFRYNGTCDSVDDCFVSTGPASGRCIGDETFEGDHYCIKGNWTTRTKYLALQLLQYASDQGITDYALFCDDFESALNEYLYVSPKTDTVPPPTGGVPAGNTVIDYLAIDCPGGTQCANNFCVLRYDTISDGNSFDDNVIAAISLNQEINGTQYSFLETLNQSRTFCDNVASTATTFQACGSNKVWYNPDAKSVAISDENINLQPLSQTFFGAIRLLLRNMINQVLGNPPPPGAGDFSYIERISDFNRIYLANHAGIKTSAVLERKYDPTVGDFSEFLIINYTGFGFDVCDVPLIKAYGNPNLPNQLLDCSFDGTSYYVTSKDPAVADLWTDFTARLRQPQP